jgi:hypothetical protein
LVEISDATCDLRTYLSCKNRSPRSLMSSATLVFS